MRILFCEFFTVRSKLTVYSVLANCIMLTGSISSKSIPSSNSVNGLYRIKLLASIINNHRDKIKYGGDDLVGDYLDCTQRWVTGSQIGSNHCLSKARFMFDTFQLSLLCEAAVLKNVRKLWVNTDESYFIWINWWSANL